MMSSGKPKRDSKSQSIRVRRFKTLLHTHSQRNEKRGHKLKNEGGEVYLIEGQASVLK